MAALSGADAGELDRLAALLTSESGRLNQIRSVLSARLASAPWYGPDAAGFQREWHSQHRGALAEAGALLQQAAEAVLRHAEEQRDASSAGGPDGSRGRPTQSGGDLSGTAASTSDYADQISKLDAGDIAWRRVSDGPPVRYVLMLRGLRLESLGSNDLTSTMADFSGSQSDYQRAIRRILEALPADAEIGVIAHSQGGMAAIEAAEGDSRIRDIIVMGSPVDHKVIPTTVRSFHAFYNEADPVPRLDEVALATALGHGPAGFILATPQLWSRAHNGYLFGGGHDTSTFTSGHDGPGLLPAHSLDASYVPALRDIESGNDPALAWSKGESSARVALQDFERRYGGDGASAAVQVIGAGTEPVPHEPPSRRITNTEF